VYRHRVVGILITLGVDESPAMRETNYILKGFIVVYL
jgi:hypothetical protein